MASEDLILPADMIFEVLTRTKSLKTLDACKTVCHEWDRIIKESDFLPNYCQRTNNVAGYFVQGMGYLEYISQFVSIDQAKGAWSWSNNTRIDKLSNTQILASCDQGILCCVKQDWEGYREKSRYYVCKPVTKQWQKLPNPKLRYQTSAIAIMLMGSNDDCLHYKIVRLSYRHSLPYLLGSSAYVVEVFDSKLWSWSEEDDLILPFDERICFVCPPVGLNSSLYFLTGHDNVLVFSSQSNSFDKISLPEQVKMNDNYFPYKLLLAYQGKLAFTAETHERDMKLWVMDYSEQNLWIKKMEFNLVKETGVQFQFLRGFYNGEIAFLNRGDEVVFHKLEDHSYGTIKLDSKINSVQNIFPFRSDLEQVNLRPKVEEAFKLPKSSKKLKKIRRRNNTLWQGGAHDLSRFWAVIQYILHLFSFVIEWFRM